MKRLTFILSALLILGISSCSKPEQGNQSEELIDLTLKISQDNSYAIEPSAQGSTVTVKNAFVVFTDNIDNITNRFKIITSGTPVDGEILVSDWNAGINFPKVKSTANRVYVLGNVPSEITIPSAGKLNPVISSFETNLITSSNQSNIQNAYLAGSQFFTPNPTVNFVTINIKPLVSRIEIKGIKAAGNITGFKVKGIYIDRTLKFVNLAGSSNGSYFTANSTDFQPTVPVVYNEFPFLMDYDAAGLATSVSNVAKPTASNVWAYNILPNYGQSPRIIIRLEEVTYVGGSFNSPMFLTINGLKTESGMPVTVNFGKIYNLDETNLIFTEENLSSLPNLLPISVSPTILPLPWTTENVKPDYN